GYSLGIYARPVNRIPLSSEAQAFFEARVYQTIWTNNVNPILQPGELTSYHKKRAWFNTSYADGHASFAFYGNGSYFPEQAVQSGSTIYPTIRGTWGRMDCLPEPAFHP